MPFQQEVLLRMILFGVLALGPLALCLTRLQASLQAIIALQLLTLQEVVIL